MADTLQIVIALFPGVTHLDFTGPHQVLCRLPGAKVTVASLAGGEIEADGLLATCLQHEMDHLEGILFIDHLSRLKRSMALKKLEKLRKVA